MRASAEWAHWITAAVSGANEKSAFNENWVVKTGAAKASSMYRQSSPQSALGHLPCVVVSRDPFLESSSNENVYR